MKQQQPLFDPSLSYPTECGLGAYIELEGRVIEVEEQFDQDHVVAVDVETKRGVFVGYTCRPPLVGYTARVRVYKWGGGWYPDNRIVGWSSPVLSFEVFRDEQKALGKTEAEIGVEWWDKLRAELSPEKVAIKTVLNMDQTQRPNYKSLWQEIKWAVTDWWNKA